MMYHTRYLYLASNRSMGRRGVSLACSNIVNNIAFARQIN